MSGDNKYENGSQQRVLLVLMALFGHEVQGVAPGQLAKALNISPSETTRDLANLKQAGLAEQMPDSGRWRITPRLCQKALTSLSAIESAAKKLDETRNRYTRNPN